MPTVVYVHPLWILHPALLKSGPSGPFSDIILQINPYMSSPCHVELILTEGDEVVQKSEQVVERENAHLTSRQRGARVRKAITAA